MINDPYIGMPIIIDNDWNEPCPDCGCRPETPDIPQDPGNHGENGGSFDSMYLGSDGRPPTPLKERCRQGPSFQSLTCPSQEA